MRPVLLPHACFHSDLLIAFRLGRKRDEEREGKKGRERRR